MDENAVIYTKLYGGIDNVAPDVINKAMVVPTPLQN